MGDVPYAGDLRVQALALLAPGTPRGDLDEAWRRRGLGARQSAGKRARGQPLWHRSTARSRRVDPQATTAARCRLRSSRSRYRADQFERHRDSAARHRDLAVAALDRFGERLIALGRFHEAPEPRAEFIDDVPLALRPACRDGSRNSPAPAPRAAERKFTGRDITESLPTLPKSPASPTARRQVSTADGARRRPVDARPETECLPSVAYRARSGISV